MIRTILRAIAVVVVIPILASAQNAVSGTWEGQTPGGSALTLATTATGDVLTGTMTVAKETQPLADGKVSKNTFSFSVTMGGGTEAFSGEVSGDQMKIWMDSRGPAAAIALTRARPKK